MEQNLVGQTVEQLETYLATSHVFIQRHAKSIANEEYDKIKDHSNFEELEKWILDPRLRDPKLCESGVRQWLEARSLVKHFKIHTIFVSPLRRSLETAYHVYKDHSDFESIRFIILPSIRESLNTSSDIPSDIDSIISEFKEVFPRLDSSLLDDCEDRKHYFIKDLQSDVSEVMTSDLKDDENDQLGSNAYELFIKESKKIFPARLESKWNVFDRAVRSKNYIKNYIRINQIPKDQKVIILSHMIYFYMHTGTWDWKCDRDHELSYPTEFIRMKNCEIVADPTDYNFHAF
jgi:hypothetical protein